MRGLQFVELRTWRFCEASDSECFRLAVVAGIQRGTSEWRPNTGHIARARSATERAEYGVDASIHEGTIATGPAIVMRYSRFVHNSGRRQGKRSDLPGSERSSFPAADRRILGTGSVRIGQRNPFWNWQENRNWKSTGYQTTNVVLAAHETAGTAEPPARRNR